MFSILILEKNRNPERSLFLSVAKEMSVDLVQADARDLRFDGAFSASVFSRPIFSFDAIVLRTYVDVGFIRQIAQLAMDADIPIYGYNPYHSNAFGSKLEDHFLMERHNIPQPKYWIPTGVDVVHFEPVVAKRTWGFGGQDVHLIQPNQSFSYEPHEWFAQEFLSDEVSDWRIYLNNGVAFPWAIQRTPQHGDFRSNLHQGGSHLLVKKNEIPGFQELSHLAEQAGKALGRLYAGVDIKFKKKQPLVLEVNRTPRIRFKPCDESFNLVKSWIESWKTSHENHLSRQQKR